MRDEKALLVQFEEIVRREIERSIYGCHATKQRHTAIRLRGNGFETVELDDAGNVIEPVICTCRVVHLAGCPFTYAVT